MKRFNFSLSAILAIGSITRAEGRSDKKRLHQVYPCVGPMRKTNEPRLTIKEYMVKMGPMLPVRFIMSVASRIVATEDNLN